MIFRLKFILLICAATSTPIQYNNTTIDDGTTTPVDVTTRPVCYCPMINPNMTTTMHYNSTDYGRTTIKPNMTTAVEFNIHPQMEANTSSRIKCQRLFDTILESWNHALSNDVKIETVHWALLEKIGFLDPIEVKSLTASSVFCELFGTKQSISLQYMPKLLKNGL